MSEKIHKQRGTSVFLGSDGRANKSVCGRWIEDCKELDDVEDEIKQQVANENGYERFSFCLNGKLRQHQAVKGNLCKICFKEELKA